MPAPLTYSDITLLEKHARDLRDGRGGETDAELARARADVLDALVDTLRRELDTSHRGTYEPAHTDALRAEADALVGRTGRGVTQDRRLRARQLEGILKKVEARM